MTNEGAHRQNTDAKPILLMITLLREFLIGLCVLCVAQVESSLYQIKHCLRSCYMGNIALKECLLPTLFVLYFPYSTRGSDLSNTYCFTL